MQQNWWAEVTGILNVVWVFIHVASKLVNLVFPGSLWVNMENHTQESFIAYLHSVTPVDAGLFFKSFFYIAVDYLKNIII